MTHVKNTEAFARLIGFCKGYGGIYNPSRPNLQIDALVNQLTEMELVLEKVKVAKDNFDNKVNQRKQSYDALSHLAASVLRTLEASGAKPEKVEDARSFVHLITGQTPKSRAPVSSDNKETKPSVKRSLLQLAYVSKVDALSKLTKTVSSEPLYQPNEMMFSQIGLEERVKELTQLNRQVADAKAGWSKSIIERNSTMYKSEASMIKTAQAVKKYSRAIFGPDSEEYALIKALVFNRPAR